MLSNPTHPAVPRSLREAEVSAQALKVRLQTLEARTPTELAATVSGAAKESADALLVLGDPMLFRERARIAEMAAKNHLPVVGNQREYADAGVRVTYGVDQGYGFRRAASYVDKILKAANAGDLPIEQPTKFNLVINSGPPRRSAFHPAVAALRADEVIQ